MQPLRGVDQVDDRPRNVDGPNINFAQGDEATSKLNIPVRRVDTEFDCFLSNSFGFGGTNSTLIVKKYK